MVRRISRSSSWSRSAPSRAWSCFALRMPMRSSKRIATSCSFVTSRRCSHCRARRCRHSIARKYASATGVSRGAYVMADSADGSPEIILIASGSEVALVIAAHETLAAQGIRSRVVSMPSWDIFEHQPQAYRDEVLLPNSESAHRRRAGFRARLGPVYRPRRQRHRHENFWRLGAAQGIGS